MTNDMPGELRVVVVPLAENDLRTGDVKAHELCHNFHLIPIINRASLLCVGA